MRYLEVKPTALLADYVKCFWFLEKDYSTAQEPIFPDGCIDVIFQFGSPLHTFATGLALTQPSSFVIGQLKQPMLLSSSGVTRVFGIRFYAYGAYPFLGIPLRELTDQTTGLDILFGKIADDIVEKLVLCEPRQAFQELEKFLLQRLVSNSADITIIRIAAQLIYREQGLVEIEALANFANMTRRSLERKFADIVGYSPKSLARILRFNHLRNELMFNPALNLTDLAYRYNYFDQAHFIHDFEQLTGQSPSVFAEKVSNRQIVFYK